MKAASKVSYRDIKAEVLARIRSNVWGPGTLLPGEVDLATEFGCARATVNRALRELAEEGVIDRRRKSGTRVRTSRVPQVRFAIPLVREEIEATGASYRYALVTREAGPAPDWLRARLALSSAAGFVHLTCMHYADGTPFQFEDRWINLAVVPQAEFVDFGVHSPNEWLVQEVPFTDAEIRFSATAADATLGRFLGLPSNSPVFTVDRTTWLAECPVTNVRLYFAGGYQMFAKY